MTTRRGFLAACAAAGLAAPAAGGDGYRRFPARCRRVIYLHMAGSPPQLDLFDYKPALVRLTGRPCPRELLERERFAFIKGVPRMLGTPFRFAQHGPSGAWFSELVPQLAAIADRLTVVQSLHTDQFNHAPAQLLLHTGSPRLGRPAMGSWIWHALGTDNPDLPGFVVLVSGGKAPSAGASAWGSGFLPTRYQGVQLRAQGDPVLFLGDPAGMGRAGRRRTLDALRDLNRLGHARHGDPEAEARIAQYELAYRMQDAVPKVCDLHAEPASVLAMYGATPGRASFANHCLLARRLVESGVRFVQLYDWGWDNHGTNPTDDMLHQLPRKCAEVDRPVAALILDLERRGLLDDTLVVWSGEFGRTPMDEERNGSKFLGRDHHPHCFTALLAGGGFRPGLVHGATDELGYRVARDPVHVHDLQATILYALGIDHQRLTHRFQGRDYRLTDVHGRVVGELV